MNGMSVTPGLLIEFAHKHHADADAAGALSRNLAGLAVPASAWGELPFSAELDERWSAAMANRVAELGRLGERLGGAPRWLRRAAADFADSDADGARRLRAAADSHGGGTEGGRPDGTAAGKAEPDRAAHRQPGGTEADAQSTLAEIATAAGLSRLVDQPADRESPGGEELMTCRAEHLSTLERAEGLLRDHGCLDFTAPSEYLRQLAAVRPGAVGGRAEPLATLAGYVGGLGEWLSADVARLAEHWDGETAAAFADHAAATRESLGGADAELSRLADEAEALWRLLDSLMSDAANAVWGRVDALGDSRIARIEAAVDLVVDTNGFAAATDATILWGGLSDEEVDAAVEVLYKRVWYLADAMAGLVSTAGDDAARLADDRREPPETQ